MTDNEIRDALAISETTDCYRNQVARLAVAGWTKALKALQEAKRDGHAARGRVDAREHRIAELERQVAEARDVAEQAVACRAVKLGANSVILVYAGEGPITAAEQLDKLAARIAELEDLLRRSGR